jgi:TRAP-type C4-dicarboxylate transport system permease small subunit
LSSTDEKASDIHGRSGIISRARWVIGAGANFLLCLMIVVTCVDVVGRYFFAAPLIGAHEMITLAMGIMIYLGLPLVTAAGEHLTVDLAGTFLGPRLRRIQQIVVNTVAALTFILMSYLLWFHGIGLAEDLITTEDFEIDMAPLAYLMAVACFLTVLVFLKHAYGGLAKKGMEHFTSRGPHEDG